MSDKIKLLPCPFCGSTNLVKSPWIECDNCGAMGPSPRDCDNYPGGWNRRATLAQQPAVVAQDPVAWQVRNGVVTHGFYRSEAEAREVAFDMQKAHSLGGSLAAFNVRPVYAAPPAAQQPDTVAVPRELLAEAESIIESYAEALKASHAPGGDWEGEEAAHDEYELEAGVASKLRALLAGGAE